MRPGRTNPSRRVGSSSRGPRVRIHLPPAERVTQTSSANARSRPDASEIPGLRAAVLNVRIHLSPPESLRTIGPSAADWLTDGQRSTALFFHVIDRPGRPFTAETQTRRWRELDLNFRSLEKINGIL